MKTIFMEIKKSIYCITEKDKRKTSLPIFQHAALQQLFDKHAIMIEKKIC
jgi:hypothetical protein